MLLPGTLLADDFDHLERHEPARGELLDVVGEVVLGLDVLHGGRLGGGQRRAAVQPEPAAFEAELEHGGEPEGRGAAQEGPPEIEVARPVAAAGGQLGLVAHVERVELRGREARGEPAGGEFQPARRRRGRRCRPGPPPPPAAGRSLSCAASSGLHRRPLPGRGVGRHRARAHHGRHGVTPVPAEGGDEIRAGHEQRLGPAGGQAQPGGKCRQHRIGVGPLRRIVHGEPPPVGGIDQHPARAGRIKVAVAELGDRKRRQPFQRQLHLRRDLGRRRLRRPAAPRA